MKNLIKYSFLILYAFQIILFIWMLMINLSFGSEGQLSDIIKDQKLAQEKNELKFYDELNKQHINLAIKHTDTKKKVFNLVLISIVNVTLLLGVSYFSFRRSEGKTEKAK